MRVVARAGAGPSPYPLPRGERVRHLGAGVGMRSGGTGGETAPIPACTWSLSPPPRRPGAAWVHAADVEAGRRKAAPCAPRATARTATRPSPARRRSRDSPCTSPTGSSSSSATGVARMPRCRRSPRSSPTRTWLTSPRSIRPRRRGLGPPTPTLRRVQRARRWPTLHHCTSCHRPGLTGHEQIPRLVGQDQAYLLKLLRGFKDKTASDLDGTMTTAAQPLTDDDIVSIVHFITTLPTE